MNEFKVIESKEYGRSSRYNKMEEFYRRYPDLLLQTYFGINLKWWQRVTIRLFPDI